MKGIERLTRKRKGRMTTIFLAKWPKGSLARRAMLMRARVRRPKRRKEEGCELTPTRIKEKKTMIFALASRWWIGLSTPL
jgi:hypothetical protein